ncbi:MAG TPA: hypothetical protein VMR86_06325 [Myxococcota bacterium]|nr:hypothetical protein [Myxococcota bacterium]
MRAGLVLSLVLISLVFSVGGVAVVGQADSERSGAQAQVTPPAGDPTHVPKLSTAPPKECKPPQRLQTSTIPLKNRSQTRVLNTHGFNYARPGELWPEAASTAKPAAAPPAAPPAAPAPN